MTVPIFKKKYGSEAACLKALLEFRMNGDGLCFNPLCKASIDKYYHPLKGRKAFICSRCLKHVYPMAGSIFDHSHIKVSDWFYIIFKMLYSRNGISANEIHREFGFAYRTVFKMLHQVRGLMMDCLDFELANSVVEIDESYVLTGNKGYGRHFPFTRGRGSLRSTSILGIIERRGIAKFIVIPDTSATTIIPEIIKNVPTSTLIYTDSWGAYNQLKSLGYKHAMVNHSKYEWVDSNTGASTNSAEGAFSNLKRCIVGSWRNVSPGKLQNYVHEQAFRHSYRFEYDYGFEILMRCFPPLSDVYGEKRKAA
ncbi:MAG: transposase [Bacteroidetes bacterium]|nr:transposase [Bacteroidota bacterium]